MGVLGRLLGRPAGRAGARASLASGVLGGYEASRLGRRLRGWVAERRNINALLRSGGELLRARARQMVRENPYAANAADAFVAAAVGSGIKPSSLHPDADLKAALQAAWLLWTDEADADGLTDFYGLQALAARAAFEAGECFLRLRARRASDGLTVPLQLQLLESEMLPLDHDEVLASGNVVRSGIEFDRIGRRVAYHFLREHPGDGSVGMASLDRMIVPAADVLHVYRPLRPGQVRGQPGITPAMIRLYLLDSHDDAELDRKRVASMFAGFVTRPPAAPGDPADALLAAEPTVTDTAIAPLEPGMIQELREGEDIKFSTPAEVGGSYEAFQYRNLLAIAAGCGLPYSMLTGDTSRGSFSTDRSSLIQFRRRVDQFQHAVLVFQMGRPVWQRFVEAAALSGAVKGLTPRRLATDRATLLTAKWFPPRPEWIDPLKDAQADKIAVDNGWKARSDVIEERGFDREEIDARRAADAVSEVNHGLPPASALIGHNGGPPLGGLHDAGGDQGAEAPPVPAAAAAA